MLTLPFKLYFSFRIWRSHKRQLLNIPKKSPGRHPIVSPAVVEQVRLENRQSAIGGNCKRTPKLVEMIQRHRKAEAESLGLNSLALPPLLQRTAQRVVRRIAPLV